MATRKKQTLSDSQVRMLKNVRDWGDPFRGVYGASAHGGAVQTELSLRKREFMTRVKVDGEWEWRLTPAGETAIAEAPPEPPPYDPNTDFSASLMTLQLNDLHSGIVVSADKRYVAAYGRAQTVTVTSIKLREVST